MVGKGPIERRLREVERWMEMRGVTTGEGSSNNVLKALEVARETTRNPLTNKGTQVCLDQKSNGYDDDLEHWIDGINSWSGS